MTGGHPNAGQVRPRDSSGGFGRILLRSCAYALAGILLLCAVVLGGLRILLPDIRHYRPEIEGWTSRLVGQKVGIGEIDAYWRGWTPVFRIQDIRLAGDEAPEGKGTPAHSPIRFTDLTFSIDLLDSLRSRTLQPRGITVSGASLAVVRRSDGTFSVQGNGVPSPGETQRSDRLAQWMLSQANLSLHSSHILWIDEKRRLRGLPLTGVALHLDREGDRRHISGSFELSRGGRIDFTMDGTGDPLSPSWSGLVYATAAEIDLDLLGLDAWWLGAEQFSGLVSGTVWSTWEHARLTEAEGTFRVQSPGVADKAGRRGFDEVSASFRAECTSRGWTLAARDLAVVTRNGPWPRSSAGVHWTAPHDGRDGAVVVSTDFARIEDLVALVPSGGDPPANPVLMTLLEATPRGELEQLRISAPVTDHVDFGRGNARGRFAHLHLGREDQPASIDAASGGFEASAQGLAVDIAAGRLRVNVPRWLAHPLHGERLAGAFTAIPGPEGIRFRFEEASLATPVGTVAAQGRVLAPRDGSAPEIDVTLDLGASKIAAVRTLLAESVLPEPVARWFEAAAPDGDIRDARLLFHGRSSKPSPADGAPSGIGGTRLEATAELALPVFRYAPGWPELTGVSGTVRFDGSRLDARVESGHVFGSAIRALRAAVEDVNAAAPVVETSGSVEGESADAMRYLAESPLREKFTGVLESLALHGRSTIDFGLALPLRDAGSATIEGKIALDGNRIDILGDDRGLEAVNGTIAFRGGGVESDGITATLHGDPIRAVIGPSPEQPNAIRLSIDGHGTRRQLAAHLHNAGFADQPLPDDFPLLARLQGDAPWSVTFDFPPTGDGAEGDRKWRFAADLTDVSLDLPPPFGKESGTERMLSIETRIEPGADQITEVRYGGLASAVFRLLPDDAGRFRLDRGAVRLDADEAMLPDTPGVTVHGVLPALDAGAWSALFEDAAALGAMDTSAPALDLLREMSIDAGLFDALGARFPDARIRMERGADGEWQIGIAGPRLEGEIRIPRDLRVAPVVADFERLVLESGPGEPRGERRDEGRTPDPRTLPALSVSARRLVLGGVDLGHVVFRTTPSERGMQIERIDTRGDAFEVDGTGHWSLVDAQHRTEFKTQVRGGDLGQMLDSLGFDGSAVAGGATDVSMRGSWAGTPADFTLDRLTGILQFHSAAGRLTRVEPGVTGRVFGLLTLTSLPRRIILDFSDLFRSGFEYDRIEGTFAIEHGHVHTNDLLMESDTARFEVVGRTGLVSEDYDKIVTVTPKISSALPFLPLWFTQKILGRDVFDKAFSYQYRITGPWDAPVIELVKIPTPEGNGEGQR